MANETEDKAGRQTQASRQSARQGRDKPDDAKPDDGKSRAGIGSSQGQDSGSPDEQQERRPSAGTPDIERGGGDDIERGAGAGESLVQDPTGAFKERP